MSQDRNEGDEFMVQDHNHMVEAPRKSDRAKRGIARQSDQAHSSSRQQVAGDQDADKRQGGGRRQNH